MFKKSPLQRLEVEFVKSILHSQLLPLSFGGFNITKVGHLNVKEVLYYWELAI